MTSSPPLTDDRFASPEAVRQELRRSPEAVIIGAFQEQILGTVGIYRDGQRKCSHKAHVWGMYVSPGARNGGIAAALIERALQHARSLPGVLWVHLRVSAAVPGAQRLYERAGFQFWATELDALRHEGQSVNDHYMALRLEPE